MADGVNYHETLFKTSDGRTVAGFMLDTNYGTEGSNLKIGVGMPYGETEFAMQPVSEQMRYAAMNGRNVLGGVNADFYDMSTGEPEGLYIQDGQELHAWERPPIPHAFPIVHSSECSKTAPQLWEAKKSTCNIRISCNRQSAETF